MLRGMIGGRSMRREVVKLGAILAADVDHVFEAGGGDQRGSRAFAFQQRVGGDRGSVNHFGALRQPPACASPARITLAGERGFERSLKVSIAPLS